MARHTGFPRRSSAKRLTDWGFGVDVLTQSMSTSTKLIGTTSLTVGEQQTIVRIRGHLHLTLLTGAASGDGFIGAAGIALVNSDAFAQGINSIPGPLTDAHWNAWMWHSFWDVRVLTGTFSDGVNAGSVQQRLEIDTKAMRKWDPAETLVLMLEGVESGTAAMEFNGDSRILLKAA